jgi:hypothetical protein
LPVAGVIMAATCQSLISYSRSAFRRRNVSRIPSRLTSGRMVADQIHIAKHLGLQRAIRRTWATAVKAPPRVPPLQYAFPQPSFDLGKCCR